MHYLRHTLQAHGSALIQMPLVPTSQMTPASRLVNLHRMETWVWGFTKRTHRKMTVQNWTFIQQKFQREKSVLHNNCIYTIFVLHTHIPQDPKLDVKLQAQKVRITLKALEGLTYMCTDALLLEDINKKLEGVMADMRSTLPAADGLVIHPAIKERIKQSEIRTAQGYSSLPQYNKRGKKRDEKLCGQENRAA